MFNLEEKIGILAYYFTPKSYLTFQMFAPSSSVLCIIRFVFDHEYKSTD